MNDNTKLDKFYTKNNIVELCTKNINTILNIDYKKDIIIEPSVGNGSFINSINKAPIEGNKINEDKIGKFIILKLNK